MRASAASACAHVYKRRNAREMLPPIKRIERAARVDPGKSEETERSEIEWEREVNLKGVHIRC